jgi:hypothetical protein
MALSVDRLWSEQSGGRDSVEQLVWGSYQIQASGSHDEATGRVIS